MLHIEELSGSRVVVPREVASSEGGCVERLLDLLTATDAARDLSESGRVIKDGGRRKQCPHSVQLTGKPLCQFYWPRSQNSGENQRL